MTVYRTPAVLSAIIALTVVMRAPTPAFAQATESQLTASVMGASGAESAGAGFRLRGTLGQPQVIGPMTGASERHVAGFWALLAGPSGVSGLLPHVMTDALHQNTPNPFNPTTMIGFSLVREGRAALVIHDVRGSTVATLVDGWLAAGAHTVAWSGLDDHGRRVPSGLYFYSLDAGDFHSVRKMMLLK